MEEGSGTTPTEGKSPQPSSPKRGTGSESTDCNQSYSKPINKASFGQDDDATTAALCHVKPHRERDTPISASNLLPVQRESIASSHEKISECNHAVSDSESAQPHAPADATTDNSNSVTIANINNDDMELIPVPAAQFEPETKPEGDPEPEVEMQKPIMVDTQPADQEVGFIIPFDVTSYPFWNSLRDLEDELYWATKAVGPSETPWVDKLLPPDNGDKCPSPKQ